MNLKLTRPSPAMVVACLALFVALGGGAYAAVKLKPNQVKAKNISSGAVTGPKIKGNAVSSGKIAANAVTAAKIANNAVSSPKIQDLSVNNAKIALNAVAAGKLDDQAVIASKIAPAAITKSKFAASGTANNTNVLNLNNSCGIATFAAPGLQAGDVVAWTFLDAPVLAGELVAQPAENMVSANTLRLQVCEVSGTAVAVAVSTLGVNWVAIR